MRRRWTWPGVVLFGLWVLAGCASERRLSLESRLLLDAYFSVHALSGSYRNFTSYPPARTRFNPSRDSQIVLWARFPNLQRPFSVRGILLAPDGGETGIEFRQDFLRDPQPSHWFHNYTLPRYVLDGPPGEWTMVLLVDGKRVGTASFVLERPGAPAAAGVPGGPPGSALDAARSAYRRGDYREALRLAEAAAREPNTAGNALAAAQRTVGLASWQLGGFRLAVETLDQALATSRRAGDAAGAAHAYLDLSLVNHSMGRLQRALELGDLALPLFKEAGDAEYGAALWRAGKIRLDMNRFAEADALFQQAAEEATNRKDEILWHRAAAGRIEAHRRQGQALPSLGLFSASRRAETDEILGWYFLDRKVYVLAGEHFRSAAESGEARRGLLPAFNPLTGLVRVELARGDLTRAREYVERLQAEVGTLGLTAQTWRFWLVKGLFHEGAGDDPAALAALLEAARQVELLRGHIQVDELRASYAEDKQELYEALLRVALRLRRHGDAFETIERAKSRAFLDLLAQRQLADQGAARPAETARYEQLESDQRALEAEVAALQDAAPDRRPDLVRRAARLRTVAEERERAARALAGTAGRTVEMTAQPADVEGLRRRLGPRTALLNYFHGKRLSAVGVLRADSLEVIQIEAPRPSEVLAFATLASDPGSTGWQEPARSLYDRLIGPLAARLGGLDRLIVSPHGALHYLPFHALLAPDGGFVATRFAMTYLPSASVLTHLPARRAGPETVLAVANPSVPGLVPLPGAEAEVRGLAALFPTRTFAGPEARKPAVLPELSRHRMLHFATHADLDVERPLDSSLRLAPSADDDGRLTVAEIFDLELPSELAVLSACSTGLAASRSGQAVAPGDELVGLSRAFLYAGARNLVVTLWPVADATTAEFMVEFYRNLRGGSKARALQAAQRTFLGGQRPSQVAHPFYWAGFVLVGDGS